MIIWRKKYTQQINLDWQVWINKSYCFINYKIVTIVGEKMNKTTILTAKAGPVCFFLHQSLPWCAQYNSVLCSKWPNFGLVEDENVMTLHLLKIQFSIDLSWKWGAVWTSISTGTGIRKGKSWNHVFYEVKMKSLTLTSCNSYANWDRSSYSTSFQSNNQCQNWALKAIVLKWELWFSYAHYCIQ